MPNWVWYAPISSESFFLFSLSLLIISSLPYPTMYIDEDHAEYWSDRDIDPPDADIHLACSIKAGIMQLLDTYILCTV